MKKLLLLASLLSILGSIHAQNQKVLIKWGTSFKSKVYQSYSTKYVLGKKGENTFVFENANLTGGDHAFYVLDKNMEVVKTVSFKFSSYVGSNHSLKHAELINDQIYIYYTYHNPKTNNYGVATQRINTSTFEIIGNDESIFESPEGNLGGAFFIRKKLSDSTRTVIFGGSSSSNVLGVAVFDENNEVIFKRTISLKINAELNSIGDIEVDEQGTVFVGVKTTFYNSDAKKNGGIPTQYYIHCFEKNSSVDNRILIDNQKYLVHNASLFVEKNKLYCLGVFRDFIYQESFKGYFLNTIDIEANKITTQKFNLFNELKLNQMKKPNFIFTENGFRMAALESKNIIKNKDGSLTFIIEQLNMQYVHSIIIINIKENGEENWTNFIERNSSKIYYIPLFKELFITKINDELVFLIYQRKGFEDSKYISLTGTPKKNILVIYKIDKNGVLTYTKQDEFEINNRFALLSDYCRLNNSEFLISGIDDKDKISFGVLKITP